MTLLSSSATADEWASSVDLPGGEQVIKLFNGKDLSGWQERDDDYYSAEEGMIRAANSKPVPLSTYLFTDGAYRNFRLLLEVKQTMGKDYSTMHSGVAFLGKVKVEAQTDDPYGFSGPLLMFCHDWGIWGADGRGRVYPPGHRGPIQKPKYEKIGDWNQIECLAVGDHIRLVANGQLVVDYTEADPSRLHESPIGLQLHRNQERQEWHFRGLLLVEDPKDELATLKK